MADGPPNAFQAIWSELHVTSFYIDVHARGNLDAQRAFCQRVDALRHLLPCDTCLPHFNAFLRVNPLPQPGQYAEGAFPYARWVCALHNNVNVRQGKRVVPFEEAKRYYVDEGPPPECPTPGLAVEDGAQGRKTTTLVLGSAVGVAVLIMIVAIMTAVFSSYS
jgi:hypothetical protein